MERKAVSKMERDATKKVALKIFRFNPEQSHHPHYRTYTLNATKGETVQDCLNRIKWQQDGSLTFRKSCRSAVCGICGIRINGKPWLACNANVFTFLDKKNTVVIEPLFRERVIRDLVVDESNFWTQIKAVIPFVSLKENEREREHRMAPEKLTLFEKSNECVMCQCCDANCSAKFSKEFLGPAALNKGYRYVVDPRDGKKRERLALYTEKGLFDKRHTIREENNCPLDIRPGDKIRKLKELAKKSS